jgi:hypothetical protein
LPFLLDKTRMGAGEIRGEEEGMIHRLGNPSSDPCGIALEKTVKGRVHRYSFRAWHPLVNIPAIHFTREELAAFLGLTVPPAPPRKKARRRI